MGKFKFSILFILSLCYLSISIPNPEIGCTLSKCLDQAGFKCSNVYLDKMNDYLDYILNSVSELF